MKRAGWVVCPIALLLCGLGLITGGLRLNLSGSMPRGLYRISPVDTGTAILCPAAEFAFAGPALYRTFGDCQDHYEPLLKHVIARPGDRVTTSPRGISVNGRAIPLTAPQQADSGGNPLTPWPAGEWSVPPGYVWVASESPRGWDSRYFGPLPAAAIRAWVRPALIW